jgi:hypothetical protein
MLFDPPKLEREGGDINGDINEDISHEIFFLCHT